jgi:hypothetical protein
VVHRKISISRLYTFRFEVVAFTVEINHLLLGTLGT